MPGPVFLHFQTYSRKPGPAGNSVAQIIGEALRRPEFSHHVPEPKPPRVVSGDAAGFDEAHAAHIAARATEVRRKGKVHKRAIREDRHTLATAVASYPLTREQIEAGGQEAAALHREWERRTVEWMRDRYGDQLRVVLAHDDEAHPHLHFWMLPDDPDARADTLHPGKAAKHLAEGVERAAGASDREAVKAGNEALKEAMRGVLDDYWREVGQPLGMTRDGPKRQRLTRAEWQARKAEAARVGETLRRAEGAGVVVSEAEAQRAAAEADAARIAEKSAALLVAAAALATEVNAGTLRRNEAGKVVAQDGKALAGGLPDLAPAIRAGADAVEARNRAAADAEAAQLARAQAEADAAAAAADRKTAGRLIERLNGLLDQAGAFLRMPGLPKAVRDAGAALLTAAGRAVPEPETTSRAGGGSSLRRRIGLDKFPAVSAPPPQPRQEPTPAPDRSDDFTM